MKEERDFISTLAIFYYITIGYATFCFGIGIVASRFQYGFEFYSNLVLLICECAFLLLNFSLGLMHYSQGSTVVVFVPLSPNNSEYPLRALLAANWGFFGFTIAILTVISFYHYSLASNNDTLLPLFESYWSVAWVLFPIAMGAFWTNTWYLSGATTATTKELIEDNVMSYFCYPNSTDFEFLAFDSEHDWLSNINWWMMIISILVCSITNLIFSILTFRSTKIPRATAERVQFWREELIGCLIFENLGRFLIFYIPVFLLLSGNVILSEGLHYHGIIATIGISTYLLFESSMRNFLFFFNLRRLNTSPEQLEDEITSVELNLKDSNDDDE